MSVERFHTDSGFLFAEVITGANEDDVKVKINFPVQFEFSADQFCERMEYLQEVVDFLDENGL